MAETTESRPAPAGRREEGIEPVLGRLGPMPRLGTAAAGPAPEADGLRAEGDPSDGGAPERRFETRARRRRRRRALRLAALFLAAAAVAAAGVALAPVRLGGGGERPASAVGLPGEGPQITTLVVLTLSDDLAQRAEALTLLALDRDGGNPIALFIPTTTLAVIPGHGFEEVGKANSVGRAALQELAVENMLGLQIDRTLAMDDTTFAALVDALGGIEVEVTETLWAPGGERRFDRAFPSGRQRMDGATALRYFTFSDPDGGELGLFPRQQKVWDGILAAGAAEGDPLPGAFASLADALETDVPPAEHGRFLSALAATDAADRAYPVLPVEPVAGDVAAYRLDRDRAAALAEEMFAGSMPSAALGAGARVELRNGNGLPDAGLEAARTLVEAGLRIVVTGNAPRFDFEETRIIIYADGEEAIALGNRVRELLGFGAVEISRRPQTIADVTVVLGRDAVEEG